MFVAALAASYFTFGLPAFLWSLAFTAGTLGIGAAIAGYQSENQGKGFWNGFVSYINDEWAQTVAIDSILTLVTIGFSKAISSVRKAGKIANECCFIKGTLIKTADGDKPIEDIKVGDLVYSENPETGEKGLKKVVQIFRNETKEWIHIHINNHTVPNENPSESEEIVCTPEHPFYILNATSDTPLVKFEGQESKGTNGSWVAAKDLKPGMQVLLANGNRGTINSVEVEHLETPEITYNFEVEDFHTYYVSSQGVLCHNKCGEILDAVPEGYEPTFKNGRYESNSGKHGFKEHIGKNGVKISRDINPEYGQYALDYAIPYPNGGKALYAYNGKDILQFMPSNGMYHGFATNIGGINGPASNWLRHYFRLK